MGRFKTLKDLINALTYYSYRIQVLNNQRTSAGVKGSQLQSLNIQFTQAKRKVHDLQQELKEKLKGEIVVVTYICDGETLEGRFVNLSDEEIEFLYKNLARWYKKEITLKEIKRYPTFLSNSPFGEGL